MLSNNAHTKIIYNTVQRQVASLYPSFCLATFMNRQVKFLHRAQLIQDRLPAGVTAATQLDARKQDEKSSSSGLISDAHMSLELRR